MSLLIESKLKEKLGRHKTDEKDMDDVRFIVPELMTHEVDPSVKMTVEGVVKDWKSDKRSELSVIWSIAPESMTHLDEKDTKHVVDLPNSAIAVIEALVGFRDA